MGVSINIRTILRLIIGVPVAAATGLGIVGFPLPATPGRAGAEQSQALLKVFFAQIRAWADHDGWRFSGASWFYLSLAAAGIGAYLSLMAEDKNELQGTWKTSLMYALPAVGIFSVGLTGQFLLGLGWDNYSSHGQLSPQILLLPGISVIIWLLGTASKSFRRNHRRR